MNFTVQQVNAISNLGLAHVGDGVYELMCRSYLCCRGDKTVLKLHRDTVEMVKAPTQAKFADKLKPLLSEEELAFFRRGKNAHTHAAPKAATPQEYADNNELAYVLTSDGVYVYYGPYVLGSYAFGPRTLLMCDRAGKYVGDVKANPYSRGTSHNACAFCPYGSICHPDTVEGRRNYKAMSSQRFWEEIGKEMQKHG